MNARQRNNITRLPQPVRYLICQLLDDGATYDEIRDTPEVANAIAERNLALHSTTFIAYRQSAEYDEYKRAVRKYSDELERRRMAAYFVDSEQGSDAIATAASFELMKLVLEKLEDGEELSSKELASISSALAGYERNRIAAAREDAKRDYAAKEAEYQSKIAELSSKIAELSGGRSGLSEKTQEEIESKIGLL